MSKKIFSAGSKQFLDTFSELGADEYGSICWHVVVEKQYGSNTKNQFLQGQMHGAVRVSDCSRSVSIDLYARNVKEVEQRIKKLKVMRQQLDNAIASMCDAKFALEHYEKIVNPDWNGETVEDSDED